MVRLASAAASNAAQAVPNAAPQQVIQYALTAAAQQHAPGLLGKPAAKPNGKAAGKCKHLAKGQWVRRGNAIILTGA